MLLVGCFGQGKAADLVNKEKEESDNAQYGIQSSFRRGAGVMERRDKRLVK
jgi:hypothetical protein